MSENIVWSKFRKAECGYVNNLGDAGKFLGYDKRDGQFVINEEQAVIVRRIYQMLLDGMVAATLPAHWTPKEFRWLTAESTGATPIFTRYYGTNNTRVMPFSTKPTSPMCYPTSV